MHKVIIQFINIEAERTKIENSTSSCSFHRLEDFTVISVGIYLPTPRIFSALREIRNESLDRLETRERMPRIYLPSRLEDNRVIIRRRLAARESIITITTCLLQRPAKMFSLNQTI
jgi:hypothetical protein